MPGAARKKIDLWKERQSQRIPTSERLFWASVEMLQLEMLRLEREIAELIGAGKIKVRRSL
jgi:hypothetical protein